MKDDTLVKAGIAGGILAGLCCATPILALILGGVGLSALAVKADFVLIPVLVPSVALVGIGLSRRRKAASCEVAPRKSTSSSVIAALRARSP